MFHFAQFTLKLMLMLTFQHIFDHFAYKFPFFSSICMIVMANNLCALKKKKQNQNQINVGSFICF